MPVLRFANRPDEQMSLVSLVAWARPGSRLCSTAFSGRILRFGAGAEPAARASSPPYG